MRDLHGPGLETRYMSDREFQALAFPILAREIFNAVRTHEARSADNASR